MNKNNITKLISPKQYVNAVTKEIINIKKNASKEALSKLDFETLNPKNSNHCIYGQMYDHCRTSNAVRIIKKCCSEVVAPMSSINSSNILFDVGFIKATKYGYLSYVSMLEKYIAIYPKQNKQIINYLKGTGKMPEITIS